MIMLRAPFLVENHTAMACTDIDLHTISRHFDFPF